MVNPETPNIPNLSNIPGMAQMTDTLEFVKHFWGGLGIPGTQGGPGAGASTVRIPGMVLPTLSVEEVNKQITDLKAVESWLALNMNMLRGTIQALEVQAATLTALNAMGQTMSATMKAADVTAAAAAAASGNGSAAGHGPNGGNGSAGNGGAEETHVDVEPTEQDQQDAANLTAPLVNAAAWWLSLIHISEPTRPY